MQWSDVLNPALSASEILTEKVPALHKARIEQFRRFTSTELIICVHFEDTEEKFTLKLGQTSAEVEKGEAIDFPQVTLKGQQSRWDRALRLMAGIIEPVDAQIDRYEGRVEVTALLKEKFERFDGVFEIKVVDLPDGPPLSFEAILNDYEAPPRARKVELEIPWETVKRLAHGEVKPADAARELRLSGAVALAIEVGGFLTKEFDIRS